MGFFKNVKKENNSQIKEKEGNATKKVMRILDEEDLETVSGGADQMGGDSLKDLSNFVQKTVVGFMAFDFKARLSLRNKPNGNIVIGAHWKSGEPILVHASYRERGWYFAYHRGTGKYGFVNPANVG